LIITILSGGLTGVIEEVIYVGETKRYRIRISKETTINVREMSTEIAGKHKEGEEVRSPGTRRT